MGEVFIRPGLIDLQVNGVNGIDFNDVSLTPKDVLDASEYLLMKGVTQFFPTVITNSDEHITQLLKILVTACDSHPLVDAMVKGFHLEGPFISPKEGAKGAHDSKYIKAPDWDVFSRYQKAAKGRIKLVTIAPEWEGACDFIKKCKENQVLVSMGHSLASTQQIRLAAEAGLSLSTHLGNGVPLLIQRHPNVLWDQLAEENLTTMIIADGHHLPDSFLRIVLKVKKDNVILVSDATKFAGMAPGEYTTFIGGEVTLDKNGKLSIKGGDGLLAGAAKNLIECIETLLSRRLASMDEAWHMASTAVHRLFEKNKVPLQNPFEDKVEFKMENNKIEIIKVHKKISDEIKQFDVTALPF